MKKNNNKNLSEEPKKKNRNEKTNSILITFSVLNEDKSKYVKLEHQLNI